MYPQLNKLLGSRHMERQEITREKLKLQPPRQLATIPTSFDARDKWPGLIGGIRDQKNCGSCWAVSVAEAVSDRAAIANGFYTEVSMSMQPCSCRNHFVLAVNGRRSRLLRQEVR